MQTASNLKERKKQVVQVEYKVLCSIEVFEQK